MKTIERAGHAIPWEKPKQSTTSKSRCPFQCRAQANNSAMWSWAWNHLSQKSVCSYELLASTKNRPNMMKHSWSMSTKTFQQATTATKELSLRNGAGGIIRQTGKICRHGACLQDCVKGKKGNQAAHGWTTCPQHGQEMPGSCQCTRTRRRQQLWSECHARQCQCQFFCMNWHVFNFIPQKPSRWFWKGWLTCCWKIVNCQINKATLDATTILHVI